MLIARDFVFLHVPKTAGGSVTHLLRDLLEPGSFRTGPGPSKHPGWRHIPPEAATLPVLAYVRNPWDWYVSWYHFHRSRTATSRMWVSAFAEQRDFATVVRAACTGAIDHDRDVVRAGLAAGMDFYSARIHDVLGDGLADERLTVGRFECLFDDLERFLRLAGTRLPDDFAASARAAPVVHRGTRKHYREYYDAGLRDLVGERCAMLCDRFGYSF